MAITCVFPALLAIPIIQALSFYTQHRKVECGSKLFIEGSYAIPRINACSFIVEVPNKTAVQITISGRGFNCKQHAEDLMKVMKRWRDYFEKISTEEFLHPPLPHAEPIPGPILSISAEEVMLALRKMKPGPIDVAAEL
ncbi:unnamed protein product [Nippostrongylus brasiliensis]|uniref:KH_dom_type_1 domain-containing protein n=1 Tax=Nippostrongylus brasiliensis TaxID=27835 RepID=A0A0N4XXZ0_NIPBR|nr:unnamed protein product [Nippostrongylus brasiliensis]